MRINILALAYGWRGSWMTKEGADVRPSMYANEADPFVQPCTRQGKSYRLKQVAPVIVEEANEIVVITVYTFYF